MSNNRLREDFREDIRMPEFNQVAPDPVQDIRDLNTALLAGISQAFRQYAGNVFYLDEATGYIMVSFDNKTPVRVNQGQKISLNYSGFTIESPTAQSIRVKYGYGEFSNSNQQVSVSTTATVAPSNTVDNTGDITVGAAATLLKAADTDTKEVMIHVPSSAANSIRVGNLSVTSASGIEVEPGSTLTLSTESAIYATRAGATDVVVSTLKLTRP